MTFGFFECTRPARSLNPAHRENIRSRSRAIRFQGAGAGGLNLASSAGCAVGCTSEVGDSFSDADNNGAVSCSSSLSESMSSCLFLWCMPTSVLRTPRADVASNFLSYTTIMAAYTSIPTDDHERLSPPPTKPLYVPPYDVESLSRHASFGPDLEHDAPRRPRYHRVGPLPAYDSDPRFKMETPSPITRAALVTLVFFLFWLALDLRKGIWIATGMGMEKEGTEMVDLSY